MKTKKKAISLIVLVLTVIVLGILATVVIINLSNTNIIEQASIAKFKNDMATYKEAYNLYLASQYAEDPYFNASSITQADYDDIFGEGYSGGMKVIDGKLVYLTTDENEQAVLDSMGIINKAETTQTLALGTKISYTPDANPTGSYNGTAYVFKEDSNAASSLFDRNTYTYVKGYFEESTTTYIPGEHEWVYMGQDEQGRDLLTTTTVGPQMFISGAIGWTNGPAKLNVLCNTLYGSSTYGSARSFDVQDINRLSNYTGTGFSYTNSSFQKVEVEVGTTVGDLITLLSKSFGTNTQVPNSDIEFEDYPVNTPYYDTETRNLQKEVIQKLFIDLDKNFWVATATTFLVDMPNYLMFNMLYFIRDTVGEVELFGSNGNMDVYNCTQFIRPVVVLDADVQIVKIGDTYSLVKM